jgi:TruD family tRNA pseudouridine synthase
MTDNNSFTKRRELDLEKLQVIALREPELFTRRNFNEDAALLESVGIGIPGKESMAHLMLKIFPSDFIVEEVTLGGRVCTVGENSDGFADMPDANFAHMTVVKCGMATMDVVNELGRILNCPTEKIQYAGIKDKWAITAQRVSIPLAVVEASGISLDDITHEQFFLKDIINGKGAIQPGQLEGNRFTILLRNDGLSDAEKEEAKNNFVLRAKEGIANFFYLQRFRAPRFTNFHWAFLILAGKYKRAVELYLTEVTGREMPYFESMREEAKAFLDDPRKLHRLFGEYPSFFETEAELTKYLASHPGDYTGALRAIENQVHMWVHALTSYFFNRKVSEYLARGTLPPETLPLMLSRDKNDLLPYAELMKQSGLFPPPLENLRPFRSIQLRHRDIQTLEKVSLDFVEILPEGMRLRFILGKGQYATTYLSHAVTIANDIERDFGKEKPVVLPEFEEIINKFAVANKARGVESLFGTESE